MRGAKFLKQPWWRCVQDAPYGAAQEKLIQTLREAYRVNKKIKFEVFIHKVDGLSDDQKVGERSYSFSSSFSFCLSQYS